MANIFAPAKPEICISPAAQRAKAHQDDIKARIQEKRDAAKARCLAGDHTVVQGSCIVCRTAQGVAPTTNNS